MSAALCICLAALALYVAVLFFYMVRISRAQKALKAKSRPGKSFWGVFAAAFALLVLPLLVPLQTYVVAVVCACAVLGEYLALRDRLEEIQNLCEKD